MSELIPNPSPKPQSYLDEAFWNHCAEGKLGFQQCRECKTWRHIPRFMCAQCGSSQWDWMESSGRGEIYSWTICYMPMSSEFDTVFPYAVVVVEMEEGVRMTAGLRELEFDALAIGLAVEVTFETNEAGAKLPFFKPRQTNT